ncbi:universal stress protein [Halorubellus salinus]|uniref:universal stress protein n=1 Tax=Halorubellus salinus TaxID=755309 RepID=UPI001D07ABD1|nr:universal stress protein [Halorubellus salinus]
MYDVVLVATDGSDGGLAAVERAVSLAAATDATVHCLYVVDVGVSMAASGVGTVAEELTESLRKMASDALDDATAVAEAAGVDHERAVVEGLPYEVITAYRDEVDADVVVVGASGESGLGARVLGSTSDRVVHESSVDVLVVRE